MSLRPIFTPEEEEIRHPGKQKTEMEEARSRILRYLMVFIAGACILAYLILGISTLMQGNVLPFFVYSVVTVIVVNFAVSRRIPYNIQASAVIIVLYGVGFYSFLTAGLYGDGKIYMLACAILSGIFFGLTPAAVALGLGVITTGVFGLGMASGSFAVPTTNLDTSKNWVNWLIATIFLCGLGVLTAMAFSILVNTLESALKGEKKTIAEVNLQNENLEITVRNARQDVEKRISQIRTAAEISRFISNQQDPSTLLQLVAEQIRTQFNVYYVGMFLVDENQYAVLRYGTGDAGKKMMAAGHRLQVGGSSMIGWCVANQKSKIALDVGREAVRFNNPDLPDTHSELALPIISHGESLGALTIQSDQANAFDDNDIRILQGVTDSLAISLENTKLLERMQQSMDEIRSLNRTYLLQGWSDAVAINGQMSYTFENEMRGKDQAVNRVKIPMTLRDETIGQITLEMEKKEFAQDDLEFVEAISVQTALALENARLIDETQRKALQEATVNRLSAEFSRGLNIDEIISSAMKEISQLPTVAEVSIYLGSSDLTAQPGHNGHNLEGAV
jgi:GAF domain-containing protein